MTVVTIQSAIEYHYGLRLVIKDCIFLLNPITQSFISFAKSDNLAKISYFLLNYFE